MVCCRFKANCVYGQLKSIDCVSLSCTEHRIYWTRVKQNRWRIMKILWLYFSQIKVAHTYSHMAECPEKWNEMMNENSTITTTHTPNSHYKEREEKTLSWRRVCLTPSRNFFQPNAVFVHSLKVFFFSARFDSFEYITHTCVYAGISFGNGVHQRNWSEEKKEHRDRRAREKE